MIEFPPLNCSCKLVLVALACALAPTIPALAVDDVAGTLFTLTNSASAPNGAWSWYEDERAIIDDSDPDNTLLLVSSISAGPGSENGDVDVLWRNLATGAQGVSELNDQFQQDDHNSAALYLRPDGRYLAMYAGHFKDNLTRWRVSTNPHDPTSWGAEQTLTNGGASTYNNIYYLPGDREGLGRTYNFTRTVGWDPNVQVSHDDGSTWAEEGKLLTEGGSGDRPYVKYASNGDKIHFITTERHPRSFQNSIYHGYVKDGVLYDSNDSVIDADLFDENGAAPGALTKVFQNGAQFNGNTMFRAWTINLEVDNTGNPAGIFSARVDDNNQDHCFFYARYDGAQWQVHEMAKAGGYLYGAEDDYTGLASIDPSNPNVVYMSSDIDPRTGAGTGKYELYKGYTADFGASWNWSAITSDSTMDNIRPVVPEWNGQSTAVSWLRGNYNTYLDWDTEVVGLEFAASDPKSLLWRGDATSPTAWDVGATANWDSGGRVSDVFLNGAEVAFDDTADSHTVDLQTSVTPIGVAFNNKASAYTVTGAGIGGAGRLRVIGGGVVTLANADNTYTGDTMIAKGALVLTGNAGISATPLIHVQSGGELDVTAATGGRYTLNNQTLTIEGNVRGNINATNNSSIKIAVNHSLDGDLDVSDAIVIGSGVVTGNLTTHSGATIQVGADSLKVFPGGGVMNPVENFESYSTGNANSGNSNAFEPNGGPWTTNIDDGSSLVAIAQDGTDQHLAFGWGSGQRGAGRAVTTIAEGDAGTYYFRIRTSDASPDASYGLSDVTSDNGFGYGDFEVQVALVNNGGPVLGARNGGAFEQLVTGLSVDTWYDIWLVVDNEADTFDAYYGTSGDPSALASATLFADDFRFRNGLAGNDLTSFLTLSNNHEDLDAQLDDIYHSSLPPSPTVITGAATLSVQGDLMLDPSSTLKIDLGDQTNHDRLDVSGAASLAGALEVTLAENAPAPQLGDSFDILDFTSATGEFHKYSLPALTPGLTWDASGLSEHGVLAVVEALPGDYNGNGVVDAADYTVWRDNLNQNASALWENSRDPSNPGAVNLTDYYYWRSHYGEFRSPGAESEAGIVPEPTARLLLAINTLSLLPYALTAHSRRCLRLSAADDWPAP